MAYSTTTPTDIDFMYKLPENEMLQAVSNSDQQIDKANDQADMFDKYINSVNALPNSQERLKQIGDSYRSQINDVRDDLSSNPAEYRQHLPRIRSISRSIQNDKDLQQIQNQYNQYQKWTTDNKDADPTLLNAAKQKILSQDSYDPKTNTYSNLNLEDISKSIDLNKKSKEWLEGMKPKTIDNSEIESVADIFNDRKGNEKIIKNANGQYLVQQGTSTKWVSKEDIKNNWLNNKNADLKLQRYQQQANKYLPGVQTIGENDGSFNVGNITPRYVQKTIPYGDYMINNAMEAAIGKYAYNETKNVRKIRPNTNQLSTAELDKENFKVNEHLLERKEKDDDAAQKRQDDLHKNISDHLDALYDNTGGGEKDKAGNEIPTASQVAAQKWFNAMGLDSNKVMNEYKSAQQNNPSITTQTQSTQTPAITKTSTTNTNPSVQATQSVTPTNTPSTQTSVVKEPVKYADGAVNLNYFNGANKLDVNVLAGNIQSTRNNIDALNRSMKTLDPSSDAYKSFNEELSRNESLLNNQTNISKSVEQFANKKYNEELIKKGIDPNKENNSYENVTNVIQHMKEDEANGVKVAGNVKSYYSNLKGIYDNAQKDAYENASKSNNQKLQTIGITDVQGKQLLNDALNSKLVPKIIDGSNGVDMSKEGLSSSTNSAKDFFKTGGSLIDNHTMSLDPQVDNSLVNYYKKKGDDVSNHLKVKEITHAPGIGAVAVVNIDNDKKPYLLKLPEDIAYNFAKNLNPTTDVGKTIQNNIVNQKKSSAISDIQPSIAYSAALVKQGIEPPSHEFTTNIGGKEIKAQINPIFNTDGSLRLIQVKAKDKDGNWIDYPSNTYPTVQNFINNLYDPITDDKKKSIR